MAGSVWGAFLAGYHAANAAVISKTAEVAATGFNLVLALAFGPGGGLWVEMGVLEVVVSADLIRLWQKCVFQKHTSENKELKVVNSRI